MTGEHTSVIYGTHYPYRLFVGCLPPDAGAEDLGTFFSEYGNVVEAKVVLDDKGCSKRFGFVTFSNKDDVADLIKSRAIKFKGKMINVGPAVKKNLDSQGGDNNQTARPIVQKTQMKQNSPTSSTTQPQTTNTPHHQQHQHKQSIYRGPQHVPKTVIRKSPTELHFDGADMIRVPPPALSTNVPQRDDSSFCSTWGISNRKSSVWSQSSSQTRSHGSSRSSSLENLDAPLLNSHRQQHDFQSAIGHHHNQNHDSALSSPALSFDGNPWARLDSFYDNSPWTRFGCGSIAPPPGFGQNNMFSKK